jgi:hypothetical protein
MPACCLRKHIIFDFQYSTPSRAPRRPRLLPLSTIGKAQGHYRRHKNEYLETTVSLSDAGFSIENDKVTESVSWGAIDVVADTRDGLIFCAPGRKVLVWLPSRAFSQEATCADIRLLLEVAGVKVRRVS